VPKKSIFTDKEAAFLRELAKNKVIFMIVGLAAAALQGAPVVTQDIDLWFENLSDPKLSRVLKKFGASLLSPPIGLSPPLFVGKGVELFDIVLHVHGLKNFREEMKNTIAVDMGGKKVRALSLERIIKSKEFLRRPKDLLTLPVLKDALMAIRAKRK